MADLKNRGTVKVVDGRYKFEGNFHYIYPNSPIRDENGELMGVTNPRDLTHVHMYGGEAPFFESLKDGKLLGTRCDNPDCENTGMTHVPFKIHCPDCLKKNTIIDITDLAIGDFVKVMDLEYPNIELLDPARSMIVGVSASRLSKGMEEGEDELAAAAALAAEAEGEEGDEGEEGAEKSAEAAQDSSEK